MNSFGFGGANAHVLLRSNPKPKEGPIQDNIPRLVAVSGRTADAVNAMLDKVNYKLSRHQLSLISSSLYSSFHFLSFAQIINIPRDDDLIALLHTIHSRNIPGHSYRGFTVLSAAPSKEVLVSLLA